MTINEVKLHNKALEFNQTYNDTTTQLGELYAIAQIITTPYYGGVDVKISLYIKTTDDIRAFIGEKIYNPTTFTINDNSEIYINLLQNCTKQLYNHRRS